MSDSSGEASAQFRHSADFQYITSNRSSFEQTVDGRIISSDESTSKVTFSFRVAVAASMAGGALAVLIAKFFPASRQKAMKASTTESGAHPFELDVLSVESAHAKSHMAKAKAKAVVGSQYNIDFKFADQATQVEFFSQERLKLCLAREVNNDANTCWLALDSNSFNAGSTSVGWDVAYVASQISEQVARNGGVINPPDSYSPAFGMGETVTLNSMGYWEGPSLGDNGKLRVVNQRTANVFIGLSQQASGDSQAKPIYAAPNPVAAQPTDFTVAQNIYVWGSNTVVQGTVTAATYTNKTKFAVSSTTRPTVYIRKDPNTNQWTFSGAS